MPMAMGISLPTTGDGLLITAKFTILWVSFWTPVSVWPTPATLSLCGLRRTSAGISTAEHHRHRVRPSMLPLPAGDKRRSTGSSLRTHNFARVNRIVFHTSDHHRLPTTSTSPASARYFGQHYTRTLPGLSRHRLNTTCALLLSEHVGHPALHCLLYGMPPSPCRTEGVLALCSGRFFRATMSTPTSFGITRRENQGHAGLTSGCNTACSSCRELPLSVL